MNIKEVKTAIKVGDFVLRNDRTPNKININFLPNLGKNILEDDSARIYIIVVDGIIKKIGGSAGKGGIKATMSFYVNAMQGSPGRPRFIIHLLIEKELRKGSKVELYMIRSPKIKAKIPGLFGYKEVEIASFKEMEDLCKSDYYSKEGRYPDWNFQENNEPYPEDLERQFIAYHQKRLDRKRA
ncbi:MAG: hypothetical protein QW484_02310 [Candidatus Pacearchaeota archaeon]